MKVTTIFIAFLCLFSTRIVAQKDTVKLKEVIINSKRISLPFSKTSRTLQLISKEDISNLPSTNVADLLQNYTGLDIRRRGVDGMQSDLYIRGGNFDQTLLLIDGIKLDDSQTGHHVMDGMVSADNIERIEVLKGPAARIFGHNAFTGAVNIVTKTPAEEAFNVTIGYGSYKNIKGAVSYANSYKNGTILASASKQTSDGYRFNTDFDNSAFFVKNTFKNYELLASYNERKFGANGFYASPDYKDQYEETQSSIVAVSSKYRKDKVTFKPRIYWRRHQDMYLFLREDPSYYRNLHISNKIGVEANTEIRSKLGKTGFGIDAYKSFLVSNNLGNHNRFSITSFLEHRFEFLSEKLDVTPGVAVSYYSDFDTEFFPGIDIGFRLNDNFKLYTNLGYTYRVPTFTDLYYVGPTTKGNPELEPESALSEELGVKFISDRFDVTLALFNRNSDNLIDWTKETADDKWETKNFSEVTTKGFEINFNYNFKLADFNQKVSMGYHFIDDDIKDNNVQYTRYSLNSLKHQFTTVLQTKFLSFLSQKLAYRFVERTDGESYHVLDAKISTSINRFDVGLLFNNVFNAEYTETNGVPMPKGNYMLNLNYKF